MLLKIKFLLQKFPKNVKIIKKPQKYYKNNLTIKKIP